MLNKPTCSISLKNHFQTSRLLHNTSVRIYADFHTSFHSKLCMECHQKMYSFDDRKFPLSAVSRSQHGKVCTGCARMFGPYKTEAILKRLIILNLIEPNIVPFYDSDSPTKTNSDFTNFIRNTRRHMRRRLINSGRSDTDQIPTHKQLEQFLGSFNTCALTGIRAPWLSSTIRLNIDHIVSISKGGGFGIDNLQPTTNFINSVKGNESDLEVLRWLELLKESIQG